MKNNEYVFLVSVYIYIHTHTHRVTGSPGVLQKRTSSLKCPYPKKYEINSNKIFTVVFIYEHLLAKNLGTLFNYNLNSNCCQFLLTFINRTKALVGIVIFKAR